MTALIPFRTQRSEGVADNTKAKFSDMMEQTRNILSANPMISPQMEKFWEAQDRMLQETEAYSQAWFKRRHEATQAALDAVQKMNGKKADSSATVQAMADWQHGSIQRMTKDMQQWFDLCTTCVGQMTQAEVEAGQKGAEEAAKTAKSAAKSAQNNKKATPV